MSGLEIERKFLVRKGDAYQRAAFASSHIQQGYIRCEDATVRVRVRDDKAYLTIKSRSVDGGLSRYEFEKEITLDEASHLLKLCRGSNPTSSAPRLRATTTSTISRCLSTLIRSGSKSCQKNTDSHA